MRLFTSKKIILTVDTEIQKLCNELLADKAGSISVMDIFTGDIIAMHSSPSFDPPLRINGSVPRLTPDHGHQL